ncbi:T6SS effector phospholipase Tle3 domain-containing protein [Paraburkholderia bannensis]|uniref:T6SS effector phospholipase Tle3 domain-containing protein n=1 Tax=Paraburkholderia bannensis TaxID=765414 RepID=UPI002ABE15BE|nr:hypothetical protein [Paraburkholderia bannensis]
MSNIKPRFVAESVCVPGDANTTPVPCPRPMPCVVIFVHGVNSEGEWYGAAENGLISGLNERLGRNDLVKNGNKFNKSVIQDDRPLKALDLKGSPVIKFYWGYRAPIDQTDAVTFHWRIPLKTRIEQPEVGSDRSSFVPYKYPSYSYKEPAKDIKGNVYYWGGGPFQNGTTALSMSWYDGFDPHVFGINIGNPAFNPERDRPLNASPKRTYYVNASKRLANLIDTIYQKYPNDTIAVVSHSQGTMIASLAMFYVKKVPDTLFLCNSPYRLTETTLDDFQMGNSAPTTKARVNTFFNMLKRFQDSQADVAAKVNPKQLEGVGGWLDKSAATPSSGASPVSAGGQPDSPADSGSLVLENPSDAKVKWTPSISTEESAGGDETSNHHNHGRVFIYCSPHDRVMGSTPLESIGWKGVDRMLPDPDQPNTWQKVSPFEKYKGVLYQRQFMRSHEVGGAPNPETPRHPGDGPVWNPPSPKIMGISDELASIDVKETIVVNGPAVPNPVSADEMKNFDEDRNKENHITLADDDDYPYYEELYSDKPKMVSYETTASTIPNNKRYRPQTPDEIVEEFKATIAAPTNHSTILMYKSGLLVERVMAYDLPIGRADSFTNRPFWKKLLKMADWLEEDPEYEEGGDYQQAGDFPMDLPEGVDGETNEVAHARSIYERS